MTNGKKARAIRKAGQEEIKTDYLELYHDKPYMITREEKVALVALAYGIPEFREVYFDKRPGHPNDPEFMVYADKSLTHFQVRVALLDWSDKQGGRIPIKSDTILVAKTETLEINFK